ncbi:MAG: biotin/lipoyl-binding protein [Bacteroidia bacterium]|nr:biotin/lipoyl-binding protein [Bacteroidia bacterium]
MIKAQVNGSADVQVEMKGADMVINGETVSFDLKQLHPGSYHLLLHGVSYQVEVLQSDRAEKKHLIRLNGKLIDIQLRDRYDDLLRELGMDAATANRVGDLRAPMPGLVVEVPVSEGQKVSKGDTLVILEAMKMENTLKATADATVKKIAVKKGQAVEKNEVLIFLA